MRRRPSNEWVILALVVLVVFAALGLGRFGFSMLLPPMQESMGLTNAESGQLQSWNSLGYLLAVLAAGFLATHYGPGVVIRVALLLIALSMVGNGLARSFPEACLARFVCGVGGGAANIPAMGLLAAWFSGRRRGVAAGCAVAGSSLGLAVTGVAVPPLLAAFAPSGWRVCWYAFGGIAFAIFVLCVLFLRDRPEESGGGPAYPAAGGRPGWAAVVGSTLLWVVAAAYFAFGFSYSIFSTFFVKHLVRGLGMSGTRAGAYWMQIGLFSIVSGFLWGWLSDRWGRRRALIAIYCCQGTAFLALGLGQGGGAAFLSGALFALTAWSIPAVVSALCGDVFGARLTPAALGLVTVVFGIGQVLGPAVGGALGDATGSLRTAFATAGIVAIALGAGACLFLPRHPRPARA
ncbi:MAG: MFS transporter [Lentisphaeria bacterium]|nr:MFS transporter [Lentisphaeria bacterium]